MQLYAFDRERRLIGAPQAFKEIDYFCMECNRIIRLRGGLHRQKHFYHLQPSNACRQNGKGMPHLHLQKMIQDAFPPGIIQLERRFPSLGRIGDAVHEELKIVFEIQCSPISFKEIEERNRDYAQLGYRVLWIFHDQQFNQKRLSEAEFFLKSAYYFSNMNKEGQGEIYDQFAHVRGTIRKQRLSRLLLDITQVCLTNGAGPSRENWQLRVKGDHLDHCQAFPDYAAKLKGRKSGLVQMLVRFYKIVFGTLLAKAAGP